MNIFRNIIGNVILLPLLIIVCIDEDAFSAVQKGPEKSFYLKLIKPDPDFLDQAEKGKHPANRTSPDVLIIYGKINKPEFFVENINNLAVYNSAGKWVPVRIDKSSLYSEFNDGKWNTMNIEFEITSDETNALQLVWGKTVAVSNTLAENIPLYSGSENNYYTFSIESSLKKESDNNYSASLDVVVDDYSDRYFLWYFFPMVLIFGVLLVRRFFLK